MTTRVVLLAALASGLAAPTALAKPAHETGGRPLMASLNGANEKPTPGDAKATGMAHVTVNLGQNQVCWDLMVENLAQPTMAHIHKGGTAEAGPVALALTPPDATGHSKGCASADAALAKDLIQNPGAYYVNVHSDAFKAGAIRGQLSK
ncbi:CHRD domain-containing protein [Phenylobacterium soli]|uniref:CHRD domain-containing protein n=1 Tax=Phenylobacterium soli TaxID=2170551 RepID=A0A328ANX9_9CAUL|nr:CHRD domain-containing protein [Phenylobacterium soli]RAK54558.1 CHRD domain-containing protein [Phenylobacterium soli]